MKNIHQIHNINLLHSSYRATHQKSLAVNVSWPFKIWKTKPFEGLELSNVFTCLTENPTHKFITAEPKEQMRLESDSQFKVSGMLSLMERSTDFDENSLTNRGITLSKVNKLDILEIERFVQTCEDGFSYSIDKNSIFALCALQPSSIYIAYFNDYPLGTAITYRSGNVVGLYQFTIVKKFQRAGFGKQLMTSLMNSLEVQESIKVVLQASLAGLGLYKSLGFHETGYLKAYERALV